MKKILFFITLIFVLAGCTSDYSSNSNHKNPDLTYSKAMISINPIKEIAYEIGGGKIEFSSFVPQGVEIHDYEPKINDMKVLEEYDAFIYNGVDMEPWIDKVLEASPKNLISYNLSDGYDIIIKDGVKDPHIWMSISGAIYYGEKIKDILSENDPTNKALYEENFKIFKKNANDLIDKYRELFLNLKNKNLITAHEAFNYLARDFSLNAKSIEDIFSSGEPNAKSMSNLVDYCRENNVKVIFNEEMMSKEITDTLAKEVGAEVLIIDTLEYENKDLKGYINRMTNNLNVIYEGLSKI